MDRPVVPATSSAAASAQQDQAALTESGAQTQVTQTQTAPQASGSGSRQPDQPTQLSEPQDVPGQGTESRTPPPLPVKTESDRTFRASALRPLTPAGESNYEQSSGAQPGPSSPRDPPMRRTTLPQAPLPVQSGVPSTTRSREAWGGTSNNPNVTYVLDDPPSAQRRLPPSRRQSTATQDWQVPQNEKTKNPVVRTTPSCA